MNYRIQKTTRETTIWYEKDGYRISFVDPCPGNTEWLLYQQWLAEGNTPEPWPPNEGGV